MHLTLYMLSAPNNHPQKIMRDLNIEYEEATPQSISDQWWFWNCKNIPKILPEYLSTLDIDPLDCIGFGLNRETAEKISNRKTKVEE